MFCKVIKRKSGLCSVLPVFSIVLVAGTAVLYLTSILHQRPQTTAVQAGKLSQFQSPIQSAEEEPPVPPCPICKPCQFAVESSAVVDVDGGGDQEEASSPGDDEESTVSDMPATDVINCSVPFWSDVTCLRRNDEVYMPVSFINPFFEVYGEMKEEQESGVRYQFQYSYGNLFPLQTPYYPGGLFNNFDHYNVEQRSKVLCVTATEGVPLTSQWKAEGYYYAITVAQYGLSHHAKALTQGQPRPKTLTDGVNLFGDWSHTGTDSMFESRSVDIGGHKEHVMYFSTPSLHWQIGPTLHIPRTKNSSLCLDVFLNGTGGITVTIVKRDGSLGYVHFDHRRDDVWDVQTDGGGHVYYGMGLDRGKKWIRLVRDIAVDWNKAFSLSGIRSPTAFDHIHNVTFYGTGFVDNFTISASHHMEHLLKAADWLVSNQDSKGGWPTDIAIKTGPIRLDPGWYSAMGQGQAMSTLVRAYNVTRKSHYLVTAEKALSLFTISSNDGGVRTHFLDKLDWYEEYPTKPYGTFVLNGFIFSLLGLYDVMVTVKGEGHIQAKSLWDSGMKSLKTMIGMFDSGTGTFYDLRHVVYHDQPNRARWDYHMVHIQLIQQLAIMDGDPIFSTTALRWIQYSHGKRAKHN